jgi:hypothetical protein
VFNLSNKRGGLPFNEVDLDRALLAGSVMAMIPRRDILPLDGGELGNRPRVTGIQGTARATRVRGTPRVRRCAAKAIDRGNRWSGK